MKYRLERAGKSYEVDVQLTPQGYVVRSEGGEPQLIRFRVRPDGSRCATTPWGDIEVVSARRGPELWALANGRRLSARIERARPLGQAGVSGAALGALRTPMAGRLLRVSAQVGDTLEAGQPVAVVEAMKMENELVAPISGVVVEVCLEAPSAIEKGALILRLEPK